MKERWEIEVYDEALREWKPSDPRVLFDSAAEAHMALSSLGEAESSKARVSRAIPAWQWALFLSPPIFLAWLIVFVFYLPAVFLHSCAKAGRKLFLAMRDFIKSENSQRIS